MRLLITGRAGFIGSTYPHPAYRKFVDWKEFSNENQVLKKYFFWCLPENSRPNAEPYPSKCRRF